MTSPPHERVPGRDRSRVDLHESEDLWTAPLAVIPGLLAEMGSDPDIVILGSGLDPAALVDPSLRLPCEAVAHLLDDCARATRCPHFGLLVGRRSGTAAIGIIGDLIQNSATVGDALELLAAHVRLADRGVVVVPRVHGARVELSLVLCDPTMRGAAVYLDTGLAVGLAVMRSLGGPAWRPVMVGMARGAPRDARPYRECFGTPVRFGKSRTALIFGVSDLARKLGRPDPVARSDLLRRVTDLESAIPATATESVIRVLSSAVTARAPTRDEVAGAVGLGSRTLCRRLLQEGTSFRQLLTEVRCGLASQFLDESDMPIADISATLHFSAPGAFTRAYKTWSGRTPAKQRAATRRAGR